MEALLTTGLRYQAVPDGPNLLFPIPPTTITYATVNRGFEAVADQENSGYVVSANDDDICKFKALAATNYCSAAVSVSLSGADPFAIDAGVGFALALSDAEGVYYADFETEDTQDGDGGGVDILACGDPW